MKYLSIILILLLSVSGFGQNKKLGKQKQTESEFLTKPFDSSLTVLPKNFIGNNLLDIFPSTFRLSVEVSKGCGQFEKTEACQSRMNAFYERPITANLKASDTLAFSLEVDCNYLADAEEIRCPQEGFSKSFLWLQGQTGASQYVGQNIFGIKKVVQYRKITGYYIEIDKDFREIIIRDIPPEKAKEVFPHLTMLVVGTLLQPFLKADSVTGDPTLQNPQQIESERAWLILEVESIWIYDFTNGRILVKKNL